MAPCCAVYFVGGQDIPNAHFRNLDPGYADYHAPPPPDVGLHAKWTAFIELTDLHTLLAHLRSVLKHEAAALGDVYVDVDQSNLDNRHFVDAEHFSAKGTQTFATVIAPAIADACGVSM